MAWVLVFVLIMPSGDERAERLHGYATQSACQQDADLMRLSHRVRRPMCEPEPEEK